MLRTGRLPAPHRGRSSSASTPGSRPTPGVLLPGTLASPRTGLPPAGCRELVARLRRGAPPFDGPRRPSYWTHIPGESAVHLGSVALASAHPSIGSDSLGSSTTSGGAKLLIEYAWRRPSWPLVPAEQGPLAVGSRLQGRQCGVAGSCWKVVGHGQEGPGAGWQLRRADRRPQRQTRTPRRRRRHRCLGLGPVLVQPLPDLA